MYQLITALNSVRDNVNRRVMEIAKLVVKGHVIRLVVIHHVTHLAWQHVYKDASQVVFHVTLHA